MHDHALGLQILRSWFQAARSLQPCDYPTHLILFRWDPSFSLSLSAVTYRAVTPQTWLPLKTHAVQRFTPAQHQIEDRMKTRFRVPSIITQPVRNSTN